MSTSPSPRLPFAMLMLLLVLGALDQTILSTATPVMARELAGNWPIAWVFSAYLLAATVVITLYGRLSDVHGRKPVLLLALGLFLLGSLACSLATDLRQIVLARALQGVGGGGLMTLSMLAVNDLYPAEEQGPRKAQLGAAYGIATVFGPLVGGWLVQALSWHWAFLVNVPLAGLAWAVLARTLPAAAPTRTNDEPSIDYAGALLLALALAALLLATQHARLGLPAWVSAGLLAAAGAKFTLGFLWRQRRARQPLLPLSLFAQPAYAAASLLAVASGVALYAAVAFVPQYLQAGLQLAPSSAAWHLAPLMLGLTADGCRHRGRAAAARAVARGAACASGQPGHARVVSAAGRSAALVAAAATGAVGRTAAAGRGPGVGVSGGHGGGAAHGARAARGRGHGRAGHAAQPGWGVRCRAAGRTAEPRRHRTDAGLAGGAWHARHGHSARGLVRRLRPRPAAGVLWRHGGRAAGVRGEPLAAGPAAHRRRGAGGPLNAHPSRSQWLSNRSAGTGLATMAPASASRACARPPAQSRPGSPASAQASASGVKPCQRPSAP